MKVTLSLSIQQQSATCLLGTEPGLRVPRQTVLSLWNSGAWIKILVSLPCSSNFIHIKSTFCVLTDKHDFYKISFPWRRRENEDVGFPNLGQRQPLRGNRKWKAEKQRTLKCVINLTKNDPVGPRWAGLRAALLCRVSVLPAPSGGSAWLDLRRWDCSTASFPEDLLIEVSPLKNHWVKLIYYIACFWFPPGQLLHNVN